MDRKTKLKKINIQRKFLLFLICITTLFMSIGYASINSVSFDINGTAQANKQEGIFITDYKYVSDVNADLENSKIESIYQSNLKSNITLSETDPNSSITYKITVYNSSDVSYYFDEVIYIKGENTFNNENITFELRTEDDNSLFLQNTEIPSKSYINLNIIFKFKDNADISNNNLESLLNFKFYRFYTISFDANGGTVDLENKNVINDKKYGELPTPERKNYIFDGWYTAKTDGDLITTDTIVNLESDQTLYAHWSLPKYTITYQMNDGLTLPTNPTYYDRESSFTLKNPLISKMGYRVDWTESIYTTDWKSGFINLSTGAYEEYNSTYPNAVISEKIFLEAGVTYTLTGIASGENRWRFFDTNGNYLKNSSSLKFTPTVDGYVIILLHNGASETIRNNLRIVSSKGETVQIKQGSTGNRIYTADIVATKIVIANIFNRDEVTINGNTPKVNSDGSVSFDSSKTFNNILVKIPSGDYSKGITMALDVYLVIADSYDGNHDDVQSLLMARTTTKNSVFLFQWQSKVQWDLGDASNYRNTLDQEQTKTGRYLFLISYSSKSEKTIIIDKNTGQIIYNNTDSYSLSSINTGITSTNYELQIGGDYYQTNDYPYDAEPQTKFYSYFFDNVGMTNNELEQLIYEFGYGNVEVS